MHALSSPAAAPSALRYELTPWNRATLSALRHAAGPLAAVAEEPPVVVHRSFVLPVTVKEVSVTRTREGMTTPLFLFSTTSEGIMPIPRRLLDPRRPTGEPTADEKVEGLIQYAPGLPMHLASFLTYNLTIPRGHFMISAPTPFESTSLVALLGEQALNVVK